MIKMKLYNEIITIIKYTVKMKHTWKKSNNLSQHVKVNKNLLLYQKCLRNRHFFYGLNGVDKALF